MGHDGPVSSSEVAYYRQNLALVHHLGFGFHADLVAPGVLKVLEPVLARRGLVVELGCGSGLLTRHLLDAGYRVMATDASEAMLDLARQTVPDARRSPGSFCQTSRSRHVMPSSRSATP